MNDELKKFITQVNYVTPLRYTSGRILEYDISSANITMLYNSNMIDESYYHYLSELPKINREIEIGKLIRTDNKYYEAIKNGIANAKLKLFQLNRINPNSVVRIANDAVYINSSVNLQYTSFDNVSFKIKSISSVMMKLNKLLLFYWYDTNGININVIGLGKNQSLHSDYLIGFIAQVIDCIERVSIEEALNMVCQFYDDFIHLRLDKYFYRELNPESMFRYKYTYFLATDVEDVNILDINYNLYMLRELYSIVLEKYNVQIRR